MKMAEATLESMSTYSQNKPFITTKEPRELDRDFEKRIWKERAHVTPEGKVYIPPMAFSNSLKEAAAYLSSELKIPGKGHERYTKHFIAGVMVTEPLILSTTIDEVQGKWYFVPSGGERGGKQRVWKCFPEIEYWSGKVVYTILDDIISKDVFRRVLVASGAIIGIGRFRPMNWGYFGKFRIKGELTWVDSEL